MSNKIAALCGGVGGAKLALGLRHAAPSGALCLIVNTGDDFSHLGLAVSPDVDTVLYTLAGLSDEARGWGLAGETWGFMAALRRLGGPDWFQLGDFDLATHVVRTQRLAAGDTLSAITADFARMLGVAAEIAPMSDAPVRTIVHSDEGALAFQDYFVARQARPRVQRIEISGAAAAALSPAAAAALDAAEAIVICPSNPWLSILPILETGAMRARLRARRVPAIAVTPLIAGRAVKGPTAKLMGELGLGVDAVTIARFYEGLIDGFVLDESDAALAPRIEALGLEVRVAPTLMSNREDKIALAHLCLDFCAALSRAGPPR